MRWCGGTEAIIWLSASHLAHVASIGRFIFFFFYSPSTGARIETLQWHSPQSMCLLILPALTKLWKGQRNSQIGK